MIQHKVDYVTCRFSIGQVDCQFTHRFLSAVNCDSCPVISSSPSTACVNNTITATRIRVISHALPNGVFLQSMRGLGVIDVFVLVRRKEHCRGHVTVEAGQYSLRRDQGPDDYCLDTPRTRIFQS